jgi:hypothetical protein
MFLDEERSYASTNGNHLFAAYLSSSWQPLSAPTFAAQKGLKVGGDATGDFRATFMGQLPLYREPALSILVTYRSRVESRSDTKRAAMISTATVNAPSPILYRAARYEQVL